MSKGLLGRKLGMTGLFSRDGQHVPITVLEVGPCVITQVKTEEKDGYNALQVGFGAKKAKKISRPMAGHFAKSGGIGFSHLREFPVDDPSAYEVGQTLKADLFAPGDIIDVAGTTKGRGFSGNIKRHGFHRGPMGHGSKNKRPPGSVGMSADPARVTKGKKMPGQYGNSRQTTRNLLVVEVRAEDNLLLVRGAVPGAANGIVEIRRPKIDRTKKTEK